MRGFITYCFSDWMQTTFANGVMRIRDGKRTDEPIRHPLPAHWERDAHYYIKPDPNFADWTYSRCHRRLRRLARPGDIIFFRTLWRSWQYFVGYFTVAEKQGEPTDPILVGHPRHSLFIPEFTTPITPALIRKLNPRAQHAHVEKYHPNVLAMFLGREHLRLNEQRTRFLKNRLDDIAKRKTR